MTELTGGPLTLVPVGNLLGEVPMVGEERWQEIHRLFLFVRPLWATRLAAERAAVRFEPPPGLQGQIDWGQAPVYFRHRSVALHIFLLTLGRSSTSAGIPGSTSTTGPAPCASRPGIARSPGILHLESLC
ncbi:MAG: hypothetical protein ACE5MM_00600 [Nitrospiraceae bacterium]